MNYTAEYPLKQNGVSKSLLFIEETLKEFRVKKRDLLEALLISEETMLLLSEHAPEEAHIKVTVTRQMGVPRIRLAIPGPPVTLENILELYPSTSWEKKPKTRSVVSCFGVMRIPLNIGTVVRKTF